MRALNNLKLSNLKQSFKIDWFDLLDVQGTQESSPETQSKSINSSALSFLYGPTLTSIHDYWRNYSTN